MDAKIKEARAGFEKLGSNYKMADNIAMEPEFMVGVPCYWIHKRGSRSDRKVIVYLHGGCYALGSINSHKALVSHLASETDSTFLFIEYSLAPEHVYPAAVNEVLLVYHFLSGSKKIRDISFMGDSAGPGLIIAVVSRLNREKNNGRLGACILISPWIDLRNESSSILSNKNLDPVLSKESLDFFGSIYIGDNNLSAVNPVEAFFGIFPPTLILVGTNEILLDDSKLIYSKISAAQPLTELQIHDNQTHVWLADDIYSDSSRKAIAEIQQFLRIAESK
jgi:monoterpene epsilon-lactone hydrolase